MYNRARLWLPFAMLNGLVLLPTITHARTDTGTIDIPQGYSAIANNYWRGGNSLAEVLPYVLDGTQLFTFNPEHQDYEAFEFDGYIWQGESNRDSSDPGKVHGY